MYDRYRLGGLENDQLLASLSALVNRENDSLSDLLAHLAELDERGLCVARGYSSLFAYCTEALGFCKSSAGRRIAAARVCRDYPEGFARVACGELQLSVLCALRPHLNAENAGELFAMCARKSFEQVEVLLAERFPKSDVRDLIRRLPASAVSAPHMGCESGAVPSTEVNPGLVLAAATAERASPDARRASGEVARPAAGHGAVKPLAADRFSVNFTADGEFRELLEEVRALLSHAEPKGDLATVMKRGLEALRGELLKKRFGVGRKPRRVRLRTTEAGVVLESTAGSSLDGGVSGSSVGSSVEQGASGSSVGSALRHTRYVPASVAREVYVRDQGRCSFCADDGRRCDERRLLQIDHVIPYAEGGESTVGNLRLRCRAHNLHTARAHFGEEYVRAAAARGRERSGATHGGERRSADPRTGGVV